MNIWKGCFFFFQLEWVWVIMVPENLLKQWNLHTGKSEGILFWSGNNLVYWLLYIYIYNIYTYTYKSQSFWYFECCFQVLNAWNWLFHFKFNLHVLPGGGVRNEDIRRLKKEQKKNHKTIVTLRPKEYAFNSTLNRLMGPTSTKAC